MSVFFFLVLSACQKVPPFTQELRLGDSESMTLIAADERDDIACWEPAFDRQACLSFDDFIEVYMLRFQCEIWKEGTPLIDARDIEIPSIPGIEEVIENGELE